VPPDTPGRSHERLQLDRALPRQPKSALDRTRSLSKPRPDPQLTRLDPALSLPVDLLATTSDVQAETRRPDVVDVYAMATNSASHDAAAAGSGRRRGVVGVCTGNTVSDL